MTEEELKEIEKRVFDVENDSWRKCAADIPALIDALRESQAYARMLWHIIDKADINPMRLKEKPCPSEE